MFIIEGRKEGRKEGKKEGRKEGEKEGRKEVGRKAEKTFSPSVFKGRREGTKEGRKEKKEARRKQARMVFSCGHRFVCPLVQCSINPLVRQSVRNERVKKWKNKRFGYLLCMFVCEGWELFFFGGLEAPAHHSAMIL